MQKTVAVLAVQGAFLEHENRVRQLGHNAIELRDAADTEKPFDALILPGGESTVQSKLLTELNMMEPLARKIRQGLPVLGTCAGLILLSKRLQDGEGNPDFPVERLSTLDVTVRRNAYGRQLGSFRVESGLELSAGESKIVPMTFIRAPYIESLGSSARACAQVDGRVVAARQENQIGIAFHPELDEELYIHEVLIGLA